jgi:hypothetical protein
MAVVQSAKTIAQVKRRDRSVSRQLGDGPASCRVGGPAGRFQGSDNQLRSSDTVSPLRYRAATIDFWGGADGATRSMTMAWSWLGATRCSSSVAIFSIRSGDRSD